MKFTAHVVQPDSNPATVNVIFADPETNPDQPAVLMFSRATDIEDSAYYFEINDQSQGAYGGLELVKFSRTGIDVRLSSELVEQVGDEDLREVHADFEIDDDLYQITLEGLKTIFSGAEIFQAL